MPAPSRGWRWATWPPSSAPTGRRGSQPRRWPPGAEPTPTRCSPRWAAGCSAGIRNEARNLRVELEDVTTLVAMPEQETDSAAFSEEALTHLDTLYRGALRLTRDPDR